MKASELLHDKWQLNEERSFLIGVAVQRDVFFEFTACGHIFFKTEKV